MKSRPLAEIEDGLRQNTFELHYQPIVSLTVERAPSLEALMRWRHPDRGLLLPAAFRKGFAEPRIRAAFGMYMLDRVFEDLVSRHVGNRQYPKLERKEGGSFIGSVAINVGSTAVFAVLWLLTLPLYAVPPLAWLVQACLWAWVTSRVMSYDALAAHASLEERRELMRRHRGALLAIGFASGLAGALPGIAWMGGALLSIVLFPFLALLSLWLYIMIFLFAGLWFQYYCLGALEEMRASAATMT